MHDGVARPRRVLRLRCEDQGRPFQPHEMYRIGLNGRATRAAGPDPAPLIDFH